MPQARFYMRSIFIYISLCIGTFLASSVEKDGQIWREMARLSLSALRRDLTAKMSNQSQSQCMKTLAIWGESLSGIKSVCGKSLFLFLWPLSLIIISFSGKRTPHLTLHFA